MSILPSITILSPTSFTLSHLSAGLDYLCTKLLVPASLPADPWAPFGPLNALHEYVIANARPLSWSVLPRYFLPAIPLYLQAYLVLESGTQWARMALGAVTVSLMWSSWTGYRFTDPMLNPLNNPITFVMYFSFAKAVEFAVIPILVDPYMVERGRPRWIAAADACLNHRMLSLGSVGLDRVGPPNATLTRVLVEKHHPVPWNARPKTRVGSVLRHLLYAGVIFAIMDTVLSFLDPIANDTILKPGGHGPGTMDAFLETTCFTLLPTTLAIPVPQLFVIFATEALSLGMLFAGMVVTYHCLAAVTIGSGLWEVDSWDVNLFNAPWLGDSVCDFWGRRWHSFIRHHLATLSVILLTIVRLPTTSFFALPLGFALSGLFHAVTMVSMDPVPDPWPVASFFLISAAGGALELIFKRATGRRVRGWAGRIWFLAFTGWAGRVVTDPWLDNGYGAGGHVLRSGVGDAISAVVQRWVLAVGPK